MTIASTASQTVVFGNGITTVFSFSFVGDSNDDMQVVYTDQFGLQTTLQPSQYLVALNAPGPNNLWGVGGTVTYPLSGSPIAAGTKLTISRVLPLQQLTSIINQGDYNPQVVEGALDTLEMQIQQLAARTGQLRGTWIPGISYTIGDIVVDGPAGENTGNIYACAISNVSTNWDNDLTAGDWSLALNVQAIVNTLPAIPNNQVFGNISGITAQPIGVSVSPLLDSAIGNTQGSLLLRGLAQWQLLAPGTPGYFLATAGAGNNPVWSPAAGTGTITGVAPGAGLAGGGIAGTVTIGFGTVADKSILANVSGGVAVPGASSLTGILDAILGNTPGLLLARGATQWVAVTALPNGTTATTQAGTDSSSKVATTAFANPGSLATTSGYVQLPSGIIIQWGQNGSNPFSFPITFPNSCFTLVASSNTNHPGNNNYELSTSFNNSQGGIFVTNQGSPTGYRWIAIGN